MQSSSPPPPQNIPGPARKGLTAETLHKMINVDNIRELSVYSQRSAPWGGEASWVGVSDPLHQSLHLGGVLAGDGDLGHLAVEGYLLEEGESEREGVNKEGVGVSAKLEVQRNSGPRSRVFLRNQNLLADKNIFQIIPVFF